MVQLVKIHWKSSTSLGQKQLNMHIMACDSNTVLCTSISGMSMFISGTQFCCSTMYGLGEFSAWATVSVAALFFPPCRTFLYEGPLEWAVLDALAPGVVPWGLFGPIFPPRNLKLRQTVEPEAMAYSLRVLVSANAFPPYIKDWRWDGKPTVDLIMPFKINMEYVSRIHITKLLPAGDLMKIWKISLPENL